MFAMSRKKVWNSIMRRKRKNHLDLGGKEESSDSGSVCKWDRDRASPFVASASRFSFFSLSLFSSLPLEKLARSRWSILEETRKIFSQEEEECLINKTNDKCQCSCMFTLIINRIMNHISAEGSCWRIVSPGYGEMCSLYRQTRLVVKNRVNR